MRPCIRIYYSNVSYCATCFEWHIAYHQELKNCIFSLWFSHVCGCRPLSAVGNHRRMKTRGCKYSFLAPDDKRCVARNMLSNKKRWNNTLYFMVASCWLFLNNLCYNARILDHQHFILWCTDPWTSTFYIMMHGSMNINILPVSYIL
jgi:hypothetical protein